MQNNNINNMYPADKKEMYKLLASQMKALLEGETNTIANLANASALMNDALDGINWVGFYLMDNGELVLGPFQGKIACVRIAVGRGVCGTAVKENTTQLVMDVHSFPGHIACDSASNSELVVPLRHQGEVVGVLDIDSPQIGRFDKIDADELEKIARIIEESCQWNSK
ncbi:GAF domain-containing protein [Clostridium sp. BNL1100]|uniref:GAF domain-containing protein n=1 Tax=Clostridium sp. BNL1100 TaxID=755731 RepID=UPI00024A7B64|nr:GAF domain-containing protein [Clostridium sp. BNL1100]AEY65316.1 GAF domain-containing protein [Clostridium sp. BNL1100]